MLERERLIVALEGRAIVEIELRLQRLVARQPEPLACRERLGEPRRRVLRRADRAHLAGLDERAERFERLVDRGAGIVLVRLVEIDAVGLQAREGILDLLHDLRALQAALAFDGHADFRREHHAIALAAPREPFPDDGFGFPAHVARHPCRIAVGGIDEVEAEVDEALEDREGGRLVGGPSEDISAQCERRDVDPGTPERPILHGFRSHASLPASVPATE